MDALIRWAIHRANQGEEVIFSIHAYEGTKPTPVSINHLINNLNNIKAEMEINLIVFTLSSIIVCI